MRNTQTILNTRKIIAFSKETKGALYAIASGLCYGTLGYFGVTLLHEDFSVFNMSFWRFLLSSLMVMLILGISYLYKLASSINKPQFMSSAECYEHTPDAHQVAATRQRMNDSTYSQCLANKEPNQQQRDCLKGKEYLKVFMSGIIFYSAASITYFIAAKYIGSGLAMVIFFAYPAIVMALNVVLYQAKINKAYYYAVAVIIFGMILLVDLHEINIDVFGIIVSIFSALCYAGYMLVSKNSSIPAMESTCLMSLGCTITCAIAAIYEGSLFLPINYQHWLHLLALSAISTVIPILLLVKAMQFISAEKASILSVLEPVVVVIVGIIFLHERITCMQIIGTVTVLSGALLALFSNSKICDQI